MKDPTRVPGRALAYLRVSTDKQVDSGLGLEAQQASVIAFNRLFLLSGLLFLLILPLLYFLKSPDHAPVQRAEPVHVEL